MHRLELRHGKATCVPIRIDAVRSFVIATFELRFNCGCLSLLPTWQTKGIGSACACQIRESSDLLIASALGDLGEREP